MRVVVWITDEAWREAVDAARALAPGEAELVLLCVASHEAEEAALAPRRGLLGRGPKPPPPAESQIGEDEAGRLLDAAAARLGRDAGRELRRGRPEDEVIEAARGAGLLVLARDGRPGPPGPKSLRPPTRFVLDHAPCAVLLAARLPRP
jgi:nucleotide-binding universal stress UspA family protein